MNLLAELSRWTSVITVCLCRTARFCDGNIMAKEETVLQGMIDKLIETGRYYGVEMNVEKKKSNENFKTTIPSNNYDRPKTT